MYEALKAECHRRKSGLDLVLIHSRFRPPDRRQKIEKLLDPCVVAQGHPPGTLEGIRGTALHRLRSSARSSSRCRAELTGTAHLLPGRTWPATRHGMAAAVVATVIFGAAAVGAVVQSRNSAWARETALPEIQSLVAQDRYAEGFALARRVSGYLDNDPAFNALLPTLSVPASIQTEPQGAAVFMRDYADVEGEWERLGDTPLADIRLPRGVFRFRIEKDGFEPVYLARSLVAAFEPPVIELAPSGTAADRVHVPGDPLPVNLSGFNTEELVTLPPFLIDRTEVTNQAFKEFVDAGGYAESKHWRHGRPSGLALVDTTEQWGPRRGSWATFQPAGATNRSAA